MRRRKNNPDHEHATRLLIAVGALVIAFSAAFSFTITGGIDRFLGLAGVGASVGVEPNEFNTLAQQLTEKEEELDERENQVVIREREVQTRSVENRDYTSLVYTTIVGLILLGLILLNFLLDIRRRKRT